MGQIVKCEICGKIYNQRHLSSHKRLSHGQSVAPRAPKNEEASIETILSIFDRLSEGGKKEVRDCLAVEGQPKP